LDDNSLYQLFKDIREVINYPHVQEALAAKEITFAEIVAHNVQERIEEFEAKFEKYSGEYTNSEIRSIIKYLLSKGFDKEILKKFFQSNTGYAIEDYIKKATPKISCFFKSQPSRADFRVFQQENNLYKSFFEYFHDFLKRNLFLEEIPEQTLPSIEPKVKA
jgi:hypothetical protein